MRYAELALLLALTGAMTPACGDGLVTEPERASTCDELVDAGRALAVAVLERLSDQVFAGSEASGSDPYEEVRSLLRHEDFDRRASELGCRPAGLRQRACTAYQGLSSNAQGEAGRAYLSAYFAACD